ncbi:MAG: acetate kinase [Oscillospiraceae bacterium]|nr:acetate kinase [Oscillospiraceae bacterium]
MKILVINCGSSSLKYQLIDMDGEQMVAKGLCERIGIDGKIKASTADGREKKFEIDLPNHTAAFYEVKKLITEGDLKVVDSLDEITAIGHRVVQGGALFKESCLVTEEVKAGIASLNDLAPLHNPAHIEGINAAQEVFGMDKPEVVVFDNAFHSTMPPKAYIYPFPYEYYEKYQVRKYGAHGTSHRYVSTRLHELHPEYRKVIICHLGNGSSITAVKDGKVIDTSMGLTPLDGFIMGSRCGAVDPSAVTFIMEKEHMTPAEASTMMNKKSGFLGVSGVSSDMRDVEIAAAGGNERAQLALDIFYYQVPKIIAGYMTALQGLDALVFTAGISENGANVREGICEKLEFLGIKIDKEKNDGLRGKEAQLNTPDSKVDIFLIPTNEELMIARDTKAIVEGMAK